MVLRWYKNIWAVESMVIEHNMLQSGTQMVLDGTKYLAHTIEYHEYHISTMGVPFPFFSLLGRTMGTSLKVPRYHQYLETL